MALEQLIKRGANPDESEAEIKLFQNEMRTAKADWEMVYYANAVHSFTDKMQVLTIVKAQLITKKQKKGLGNLYFNF